MTDTAITRIRAAEIMISFQLETKSIDLSDRDSSGQFLVRLTLYWTASTKLYKDRCSRF